VKKRKRKRRTKVSERWRGRAKKRDAKEKTTPKKNGSLKEWS